MAKWSPPQNNEEAYQILLEAHSAILPSKIDWESEEFSDLVKELVRLTGSFNSNIAPYRSTFIELIASLGNLAIEPMLEVLVERPRAEQFDLTQAVIKQMIRRARYE